MSADARAGSKGSRAPLGALKSVLPYALVYRGRIFAALAALLVASAATLVVPVAVRRMIDFGFSDSNAGFIRVYFLGMLGVVAVLALASGARYYLVMTLGERVVADLRANLFAPLRRHDAAQGDFWLLGLGRAAQSLHVRRRDRDDGGDQPQAFGLRARRDPNHRAAAVRRRPRGPPAFPPRPGHARGSNRLRDREPVGGPGH